MYACIVDEYVEAVALLVLVPVGKGVDGLGLCDV